MPRILGYTPPWLSRPSMGYDFFSPSHQPAKHDAVSTEPGVARLIARRGTQIFIVVDNEIRWTDLNYLKDYYDDSKSKSRKTPPSDSDFPETIYRTVKFPVPEPITQLSVSPQGDFLAIITTHTVYIALIFDNYDVDIGPLKLKSFELGKTEHRIDGSTIVCGLWHPLGVQGRCFVTITEDGVVRLWELNRDDRSSFEASSLSIDLKKLMNAKDAQDTLRASTYGYSNSFSPDSAYLQPVAASFGGLGRNGENPWSSMTLWIAMADGDLYALCPLLPSRFQSFTGLLSSLTNLLNAKSSEYMTGSSSTSEEEAQLRQETLWIQDLELQEPYRPSGAQYHIRGPVYSRPPNPRAEPKLQGPFELDSEDLEITDIFIRNVSVAEEPLEFETGEVIFDEDEDLDPLAVSVICLVTSSGYLHVLLDLDGIEPRWLPAKTPQSTPKKGAIIATNMEDSIWNLLELQAIQIWQSENVKTDTAQALITADVRSEYGFFITHGNGVSHISFDSFIEHLQDLLADPANAGANLRVDAVLGNAKPKVEEIIEFSGTEPISADTFACVALVEEDLGYLVLTSSNGRPYAASLDTRFHESLNTSTYSNVPRERSDFDRVIEREPHRLYEPADALQANKNIPTMLKDLSSRMATTMRPNGQISEETLSILIEAHRLFSAENERLSTAVSDLFRACPTMVDILQDQVQKVGDVSRRIDRISGNDEENYGGSGDGSRGRARIEERMENANNKQMELLSKYKEIQQKLGSLSGRKFSDREKQFLKEIEDLDAKFESGAEKADKGALHTRFEDLQQLCEDLKKEKGQLEEEISKLFNVDHSSRQQIPPSYRKAKMDSILKMLERESAMVESTQERLSRLSIQIQPVN